MRLVKILAGEVYSGDHYHSSSITGVSPYYRIILIQNKYLMLVLTKKSCSSNNKPCVFKAQWWLSTLKSIESWVLNNFTQHGFQTAKEKLPVPRGTPWGAKAAASSPCWDPEHPEQCSWLLFPPRRCHPLEGCVPVSHPPTAGQGRVLAADFCSCLSESCNSPPSLVSPVKGLCWAKMHLWVSGTAETQWDSFTGILWVFWQCLRG